VKAVRPALESGRPIAQIAADPGIHREALRAWVRHARADAGRRPEREDASQVRTGHAPRIMAGLRNLAI
jgi:transposase-like protein